MLATIAWWDDHKNVSPVYRLAIQALAACCLLIAVSFQLPSSDSPQPLWWMLLLAIVLLPSIVWSINLYNFMDGMDGLATAMAIIGFGCLAWFGWQAGQVIYVSMALMVVAACAGFLPFNLHPARMFMGDVGSTLLGFWVAGFSLWGITLNLYSWWVPLVLFSSFWVDATATLFIRIWRKEKIFHAHKSHIYQRLVRSGLGQHRTLLIEIALMSACVFFATQTGHP
jgi:UDP-N-acetylmuramyl pentapeptide phosphotransferase/UDP-N-acetylglucosamine-1-phosphate transferase